MVNAKSESLVLDIADQRIEEVPQRSAENLSILLNAIPSGIVVIDAERHVIVDANPVALGMIGAPREEVIGAVCHNYICPADICPVTELGQTVDHSERVLLTADGRSLPILKSVTTVMLDGREHLIESFIDITERINAEKALRESEEKHRTVLENIEEGYYQVDLAGNLTFLNDGLCSILGCPRDELMGMNIRQCMDEATAKRLFQTFNTIYTTGESARAFGWKIVGKDGTSRLLEASVSLLPDADGEPIGFRGIVRDITSEHHSEVEREELLTMLENRSTQLQTAAEVSRAVSSILDPEALTPQVVDLVRERFDLYYAGLFLVDQTGEWTGEPYKWAVLRAGTGEAGRQMLQRGHKLEIGGSSMIGWCVANKQARIALDVGEDAVRFDNPALPETRSELALPLINRGRPIGALTIQSDREAAFGREDITVLQTLADQLANAIANARLYNQAHREINERKRAEEETRRRAAQAALVYDVGRGVSGKLEPEDLISEVVTAVQDSFDLYGVSLLLLDGETQRLKLQSVAGGFADDFSQEISFAVGEGMIGQAAATGESQISGDVGRDPHYVRQGDERTKSELAVPIKSGQEIVGVLDLQSDRFHAFDETDALVMGTLADQIGVAIENAHLYQAMQQELIERRRAEEALRESEERYRLLFNTGNDFIFVYPVTEGGAPGKFIEVNDVACQRLGYTRKELLELTPQNLAENDEVADFGRFDEKVLSKQHAIFERVLLSKEGGRIHVENNAHLFDLNGQTTVLAIARDITERRQAEAALREAHEELARYTDNLERRTAQLQVGAEVAREAAAILDVQQLLDTAVHLICERFGFYHAGVFLVDELDEYAVMRAASSEGGRRMLERGHRLQVGRVGIVGYVAATGEPRIALDVGEDAMHFAHGDLPDTRSEMGLPLTVHGRTIGVLDVQSIQEGAFSDDDVAVLQTLADQLAVAIDNARLAERTETQLRELSLLYGEYSEDIRSELASSEHRMGFVYDRTDVQPTRNLSAPVLDLALAQGETVSMVNPDTAERMLATPLKLHDQVIGTLGFQEVDGGRGWSPNEIALVEAVSEQVALALENAQHFAETQRSARQMRVLNELGQALAASLNVDQVLEESYRGASRLLDTSNFFIGLYDEETNEVSIKLNVTESTADSQVTVLSADQGIAGFMIRNQTSVLLEENVAEWQEERGIESVGEPASSWVGVPILIGDRVLGVIVAQSYGTTHAYDERDLNILTSIASQTAIALQNTNLFEVAQRKATQFAAAAEVARDATSILDVDQLLDETVNLISAQFGFYQAGVFLLDEQREYAVLRAASSPGGHRMLARGHKLPVGKVGIVGNVAATGQPRIALDVGEDAWHFVNPDLPDTRSEMGLPLKVRERVIGVLDVQSTEESAFSDEDVAVMETLADQLAGAIVNAQLFQEVRTEAMRRALINEVQEAAATSLRPDELLHRTGEVISRRLQRASALYVWDPQEKNLRPIAIHDQEGEDVLLGDEIRVTRRVNPILFSDVVDGRRTSVVDLRISHPNEPTSLAEQVGIETGMVVPLTVRDQLLGILALSHSDDRSTEETGFVEIIGANLSVALENARLYQEALETAEILLEMDRLKSQFLANMSHELRTPLNSIIGFSRVILKGIDGPLTDMQRTDLEAVYSSGQHLLGLINDILDISKIQAGKMEITIGNTDLNDIVKGVMSTAIALVKDKPIQLQQFVPPDLPVVQADARRIRQVLLNIIGNATKFTDEGFIRVEVERTRTEVIVGVADSGVGIPEDKIQTIFEEFTQVDGSSTRAVGGTGLGLAISRRFVEMHGGRIWVESTPGIGSTFYVALPIEGPSEPSEEPEDEEPEAVKDQQPEPQKEANRAVVLCVDDDEGVITLFRRYLSKQGYTVIGLTEGKKVMEEARALRPFAITLDVMMPQKDGWQIIQELKSSPETRHIPVIMCTIVADKERGISLGASGYLVKPILEDDLVVALEQLDHKEAEHHQVLVVDDHPEDRSLVRRMIESQQGYEVIEAAGGREAIELLQSTRPHVIILDLMMPDVDGFAVLESVKANRATRDIPIIVVTAKDLTQEERNNLNNRVQALLQKGIFEQGELLADVGAALARLTVPSLD